MNGLQRQPNRWTCGPAALRHALLCHGVKASTRTLAKLAGITKTFDGDTVPGLREAAASKGFRIDHLVRDRPAAVKMALDRYQPSRSIFRTPVLMCTETWNHWVCVHSALAGNVAYLDSQRDGGEIERVVTWSEFLHRTAVWQGGVRWDLYPVVKI